MRPKIFTFIVLLAAWVGLMRATDALAQQPPSFLLNAKSAKAVSAVVDPGGVEVHIYCDFSVDPWATPGDSRNRNTWISPVRCAQIDALAHGLRPNAKAKQDFALALLYLLRGSNIAVGLHFDVAECKAFQQVEFLAEELGVGRGYARDLANLAWRRFRFKPIGCRPGGVMDFHLGRWPEAAYLPPEEGGKGGVG